MNQSRTPAESSPGMSLRMEYAGVIAVVFFLIGAFVGNTFTGKTANCSSHSPTSGVMATSPENLTAKDFTEMGNQAYGAGDAPAAIRAYERSLQLEPDNPDVITDLGTMYLHNGQIDAAISKFRQAMSLAPDHPNSRFNLGIALMHTKDWDDAIEAFRDSMRISPDGDLAGRAKAHIETIEKTKREE